MSGRERESFKIFCSGARLSNKIMALSRMRYGRIWTGNATDLRGALNYSAAQIYSESDKGWGGSKVFGRPQLYCK